MPQRIVRNACGQRLMARYHVNLLVEEPVECISVRPGRSGHARIMRPGSDNPALDPVLANHADVTSLLL